MLLFLEAIKPGEIILILAVVLLLFGGKKIPELMKGLGQGIKEFKDASKGGTDKDATPKEGEDTKGQLK
jgi:sec-independent protein translocase protein TatA